ncbi:MAG: hypothetical protein O3C40_35715 [Planctomycetota bacterium]|nr:hypothetical protein [Planctomycetota bacterium]
MSQALGITSRKSSVPIGFQATNDGITLTASNESIAIRHTIPGAETSGAFAIPLSALADCEGRGDEVVTFRREGDSVIVEWRDGGIPQTARHDVLENPAMPSDVESAVVCDQSLMRALADAVDTADREPTRYALNCIQLRANGQILATDGRQAYVHGGFDFPWTEDLLVPASRVLTRKGLAEAAEVAIGASDDWVQLQAGDWEVWFKINHDDRFPCVDEHVPSPDVATTTLQFDDEDAQFLIKAMSRLPGVREMNAPITLDLNGQVSVRAQADEQITEVVLCRSSRQGDEIRCNTNRTFLARAARLGFRDVHFHGPETPAVCRESNRTYFWALLGKEGAIKASDNMQRIESAERAGPRTSRPSTIERANMKETTMTPTSESQSADPITPLEAAETLRDSLKESLTRTRELIASLRRRKKQSRLVESTLASLRQLQDVA